MPQVSFIPRDVPSRGGGFDPAEGIATLSQILQIQRTAKYQNQIYQQQIDLHSQLDPLEIQGKQQSLQLEQQKFDLEKQLGPIQVQNAQLDVTQKPLLFDDQLKLNATARALNEQHIAESQARIKESDLDMETKKAQLNQLELMGPLNLEHMKSEILQSQTAVQSSLAQMDESKQRLELAKQDRDFNQLQLGVSAWDSMSLSGRQQLKDDPRYASNPVVQALDINGSQKEVLSGVEKKAMEIVQNQEKYSPSDIGFAQKTLGALISAKAGFNTENLSIDKATGLPIKTKTSQFPDIGSIFSIKQKGSGGSTQPTMIVKPVGAQPQDGAKDVSSLSYGDYKVAGGAMKKRMDTYLGGDVASNLSKYRDANIRDIYPNSTGFDSEKNKREDLVKSTIFLGDRTATLLQTKNYNDLIKDYVMNGGGLRSQKKVQGLDTKIKTLITENPGSLTLSQKTQFEKLVDYFEE